MYLVVVLWQAVIVGRDGGDELGTGVAKHVLKHLLLSLLQPRHLVLKPLLQLRVHSLVHMLMSKMWQKSLKSWYVHVHDFVVLTCFIYLRVQS